MRRPARWFVMFAAAAGVVASPGNSSVCVARGPKTFPPFQKIDQAVRRHFASQKDYRPGDLITQRDVESLFAPLEKLGWSIASKKELLAECLSDREALVRQLHTRKGRRFMRRIAGTAGGYDRLYRLSTLPDGRRIVDQLIHDPGGYELVDYLANSRGGTALSRQLSRTPKGGNFSQPADYLFTEDQLVGRLKQLYDRQKKS